MNFKTMLAVTMMIVTCNAITPAQYAAQQSKQEIVLLTLKLAAASLKNDHQRVRKAKVLLSAHQRLINLCTE